MIPNRIDLVSIHAPPEEGDPPGKLAQPALRVSIHAPPEEGDDAAVDQRTVHPRVSIHAPPEEGDGGFGLLGQRHTAGVSIHAPPEEGDA